MVSSSESTPPEATLWGSVQALWKERDDRLPPAMLRELAIDALGLIGVGSLLVFVLNALLMPFDTPAGWLVSGLMASLPLWLREGVKRWYGSATLPLILAGTLALGAAWVLVIGTLQSVQAAVFLLPLACSAFVFGSRAGVLGAVMVALLAFVLAYWQQIQALPGAVQLDPYSQAQVLAIFSLLLALCVASLRRYVARAHREALHERALRAEDGRVRMLNERLQLALRGGGFGVWEFDVAQGRFSIDARQSELYGLPAEARETDLASWVRAVHPEDRDAVHRCFDAMLNDHVPYDMAFRIVQPDGSVRWLRSLGEAQRGPDGRVLRVAGLDRDVTEQESANQRLRQLSERMLLATESAQLGVWELVAGGGQVSADATARRLFGVSADAELVREDIRLAIHPEDRQVIRELVDHGLRTALPIEAQFRVQGADGSVRWLRSAASMPRDADGRTRRMVGVSWDITRDTELQRQLGESSRRQALALQAIGAAAWVVHGRDLRIEWSDHWSDVYGLPPDAPGGAWLDRVLPEERAETEARWRHALRPDGEAEFAFECRIAHPERGLRRIRVVGRCEHEADGALRLAYGLDMDVTAQRAAVRQVRELSERLDRAAAASGMGSWQYDVTSGRLSWDERTARLFGLGPEAGGLSAWLACVAAADRVALRFLVEGGPGAPERIEVQLPPEPGAPQGRRLRLQAQDVSDEHGGAWQRAGAAFDITAEWQARQAIEQARREAEAASRSKSAFLANMSHEIRTPMNAVIGLTRLLLDTVHESPARDYAAKGHAAARGLLAVLNDVLDLSKIEAGKLELDHSEFRLDELLDTVRDLLGHTAEAKGLALRVERDPALADVYRGDRVRLQQILLNLGSNAVKFTERGAVSLRLSAVGDVLRLEVEDSGIGMTPEAQARIFEAFEQADVSTARRFGGTGLGLTICRHLVGLMGGELRLVSTPGVGTRFWCELPRLEPLHGAHPELDPSTLAAGLAPLAGARVLLVEDNELNRLVGAAMLEQLGAEVLVAESGEQALARLGDGPVDLVLMDIQMPDMDGLEATRRIRALPGHAARVPIVAMTANAMAGDRELSLAAGMNDHVTKPIEREALGAVIERWLSAS